jgi:hypothetical protein
MAAARRSPSSRLQALAGIYHGGALLGLNDVVLKGPNVLCVQLRVLEELHLAEGLSVVAFLEGIPDPECTTIPQILFALGGRSVEGGEERGRGVALGRGGAARPRLEDGVAGGRGRC